jgi:hemolysin activation/secretion protein
MCIENETNTQMQINIEQQPVVDRQNDCIREDDLRKENGCNNQVKKIEVEKNKKEVLKKQKEDKASKFLNSKNQKSVIQTIYLLKEDRKLTDFTKKGVQIEIPKNDLCYEKLKFSLMDFVGKSLNEKNICLIKKTISDYYVNKGHLFAVVTTPEQKIEKGTIKFVITESRLESFEVKGNHYFKKNAYKKYMNLKNNSPIDVAKIRRNVSSINRNPFRNANAIFKSGEKENTTDIEFWVQDRWPYRLYAGIDNTGIKSTGSNRLFTGINFGNLWGLDHVATYQFTTGSNVHRFHSHTMSYTMPLFYTHFLTVYGGLSKIEPKKQIQDVENDGRSGQASIRYIVPLTPITEYSHELNLGFDYKYSNINMCYRGEPFIKNTVNLTQFEAKYEGKYQMEKMTFPFSLELYGSPGKMISKQSNENFSELRYKAKNHYLYSVLQFQPYFQLKRNFTLWINLMNQLSTQNLISSEQIGIGGYNSVRGYPERYINKDNGFLTNIELRSSSMQFTKKYPLHMQLLAFLDAGVGWDSHATPNIKNTRYLISMGPGLRFNIRNYLVSRVDLGLRLKKINGKHHYGKIHFSLIGSY